MIQQREPQASVYPKEKVEVTYIYDIELEIRKTLRKQNQGKWKTLRYITVN